MLTFSLSPLCWQCCCLKKFEINPPGNFNHYLFNQSPGPTYPALFLNFCSLLPAQRETRQTVQEQEVYFGWSRDFSSLRSSTLSSQLLTDEEIAASWNKWKRKWSCTETKSEGRNRGVSKAFVPLLRQKTANGTEGQALSDMLSDAPNVFYYEVRAPSHLFL